jgi:uncharacterized protein (TIGR00255 family)
LPNSMTAFAQGELKDSFGTLRCELRAVNHRYLDIGMQLPEMLKPAEHALRELLRSRMQRGKVTLVMGFELQRSLQTQVVIDEPMAKAYIEAANQVAAQMENPAPLDPMDILRSPGVILASEQAPEGIADKTVELVSTVLDSFIENRLREGQALADLIVERVETISAQVDQIEKVVPEIRAALNQKLRKKLDELKSEANADRLEQEMVYQAQRMDVDEEIDRLRTHLQEMKMQLGKSEPIGRRLDFLAQELNREANTLASKSQGVASSQGAIEIKVCIEQIREQIQNIE